MMLIMSCALNAAIDPAQVMPVECEKPYINATAPSFRLTRSGPT